LFQELLHNEVSSLHVSIKSAFQNIGEKDQFEDEKEDGHFDKDQLPQGFSQGHRTEAVNIKTDYEFHGIQKRGRL
jgi:hypothetical protein